MAKPVPPTYTALEDIPWAPEPKIIRCCRPFHAEFYHRELDRFGMEPPHWDQKVLAVISVGPPNSQTKFRVSKELLYHHCHYLGKLGEQIAPHASPHFKLEDVSRSTTELFVQWLEHNDFEIVRDGDSQDLDFSEYVKLYQLATKLELPILQNIVAEFVHAFIRSNKIDGASLIKFLNCTHVVYADNMEDAPLCRLSINAALYFITYSSVEDFDGMLYQLSPMARYRFLKYLKHNCVTKIWKPPILEKIEGLQNERIELLEDEVSPLGSRMEYFVEYAWVYDRDRAFDGKRSPPYWTYN